MGWKHYTIQTLKALGLLAVGFTVFAWWIMSFVLSCGTSRNKGMH